MSKKISLEFTAPQLRALLALTDVGYQTLCNVEPMTEEAKSEVRRNTGATSAGEVLWKVKQAVTELSPSA